MWTEGAEVGAKSRILIQEGGRKPSNLNTQAETDFILSTLPP